MLDAPTHSDEIKIIEVLFDAWELARLKFEHFCDLLDDDLDDAEISKQWAVAVADEKEARIALLSHKDETIEGVRLRARFINIMVEKDHVGSDFGDFTEEMSVLVKSLIQIESHRK